MYRYLNLVRYSIFDTRYSILDTFVVNVISSTYSGATWNDCAMSIYYFSKKKILWNIPGKTKCRIFFENPIFFLANPNSFLANPIFFLENPIFFLENIRNTGGCPLPYTTFRKHTKSGVWSLSEFPCFIVYAARNIPSISDTMWCKPGFILRTP